MSAQRRKNRKYALDLAKAKTDLSTGKIMNRYYKKLAEFVAIGDVSKLRELFNSEKKMSQTDRKALMNAMLNIAQKDKKDLELKQEANRLIDNTD